MKNKMFLPEFCGYLCINGFCDDIECQSCILDKLMYENINFEIKKTDIPVDEKDRGNK